MASGHDVVIVGGGSAGCVLAARLSEDPARSVCLIEAGPDYGPYAEGRWPADVLDARALPMTHLWEQEPEDRSVSRARIIGGCSAHNACIVLAGAPADYDEWGPGWTSIELEPHLRRAASELGTRHLDPADLTPWHAAFARAGGDDAILHDVNDVGGVRWNAAFAYLDPARGRPNLTVLAETLAERVLLDGDRARGVATDAGDVAGRTIVLAAGAYGSPAILLRSGIGADTGLPVGEGLIDHVGVGIGWRATDALRREVDAFAETRAPYMAQVTLRARSSRCPPDVSDLFLFPALDPGSEISAAVFAMKPHSRGRVSLRSRDPRRPPAIDHGSWTTRAMRTCSSRALRRCARSPAPSPSRATSPRRNGRASTPTWTPTCVRPRAASSTPSERARSAPSPTTAHACSASRTSSWGMRR